MALVPEIQLNEDYEKERGKPMPSLNHGVVQAKLSFVLILACRDQYLVGNEVTLGTEPPLTPDLVVTRERQLDWLRDELRLMEAPLTAIEIASPSQSINEFFPHIESYFRFGVQSAWLVQPPLEQVVVFTPNFEAQVYSEGEVVDPALDVGIALDEIFT
ncbi:MAG: Uma2 family endonuclease [Caldilineaceae bacterium]|nr:Uma2 family endonuclease [Caldilineaceae bacterium]MCY4117992.1 Uma2 family endonuclease [Caldilineaceae bacterium]